LYRVRRKRRFRFTLKNPASYSKAYSHIHQVESLHNSPYSTTTAGVRQIVMVTIATRAAGGNGSKVLIG